MSIAQPTAKPAADRRDKRYGYDSGFDKGKYLFRKVGSKRRGVRHRRQLHPCSQFHRPGADPRHPSGSGPFCLGRRRGGDGAYDYLVDRCADDHQKLEAYLNDGKYLWTVDLGYNSENKNNISPGALTIDAPDVGVPLSTTSTATEERRFWCVSDGVQFGDGTTYEKTPKRVGLAVIDGARRVGDERRGAG